MESLDKNREGQIWQRVRNSPAVPPAGGLRALRREALGLAGIYRQLMSAMAGRAGEMAGQLYREEAASAACLRGLEVLRGEDGGNMKIPQPPKEPAVRLLQGCYQRTRLCLTEYTARSAETESGIVFRRLADRAEAQCERIAQLLGML